MGNQPSSFSCTTTKTTATTTTSTTSTTSPSTKKNGSPGVAAATSSSSPSLLLLWGCNTHSEQCAKIEHAIQTAATATAMTVDHDDDTPQQQQQSLLLLSCGFEYRIVHAVPPFCHCNSTDNSSSDHGDTFVQQNQKHEENDRQMSDLEDEDDFDFINDETHENENNNENDKEFMVPIGVPLHKSLSSHLLLMNDNDEDNNFKPSLTHSISNLSLFSLSTHLSTSSSQQQTNQHNTTHNHQDDKDDTEIPHYCALRLVHVPTNTPLNVHNHTHYIAPGPMYDAIADLCTRAAHEIMHQLLSLETVHIALPNKNTTTAHQQPPKTSTAFVHRRQQITTTTTSTTPQPPRQILIIITGKGQVRAGIFSRRLLITHGLEAATAISFLHEAITNTRRTNNNNNNHSKEGEDQQKDENSIHNHHHHHPHLIWDELWMLDPNALGEQHAFAIVSASLDHILQQQTQTQTDKDDIQTSSSSLPSFQIYVLAHSMAGSQLVRYLHAQMMNQPSSQKNHLDDHTSTTTTTPRVSSSSSLFPSIRAIAFTDSNHNIQWTKKDTPELYEFLQGDACVYIKSISKHEHSMTSTSVRSRQQSSQSYPLGKVYHGCSFWKHRFGNIRTIYAGTREHALTNYAARQYIWNHFDHCYQQQ